MPPQALGPKAPSTLTTPQHLNQAMLTCCVSASVWSSFEIMPEALESELLSDTLLLMFSVDDLPPHLVLMTSAAGTASRCV